MAKTRLETLSEQVRAARRILYRRLTISPNAPKTTVFIAGAQRSGTTMLLDILETLPQARIYGENHPAVTDHFRLRPYDVVARVIAQTPARAVILKPICDTQHMDRVLEALPQARAIWLYRHYYDTARSAVLKWGKEQRKVVRNILNNDPHDVGWRGERLPDEAIEAVRAVYYEDITREEGAMLFWYLRNQFYFSLDLVNHPRVTLIRYEDLVTDPQTHFQRVFEIAGLPFAPELVNAVFSSSVNKQPEEPLNPAIVALCEGLYAQLNAVNSERAPV